MGTYDGAFMFETFLCTETFLLCFVLSAFSKIEMIEVIRINCIAALLCSGLELPAVPGCAAPIACAAVMLLCTCPYVDMESCRRGGHDGFRFGRGT